jgi:hypothetical protein
MPRKPHLRWFDHSNNIWWVVQIMKLLIMQFSPSSCHVLSHMSSAPFSHTLSICVLLLGRQTKHQTHTKYRWSSEDYCPLGCDADASEEHAVRIFTWPEAQGNAFHRSVCKSLQTAQFHMLRLHLKSAYSVNPRTSYLMQATLQEKSSMCERVNLQLEGECSLLPKDDVTVTSPTDDDTPSFPYSLLISQVNFVHCILKSVCSACLNLLDNEHGGGIPTRTSILVHLTSVMRGTE